MYRIILIAVCLTGFIIQGHGQCPEKTGRYPVSGQCDAYLECIDGVAEEKLCPDGLLFNDKLSPMAYPCQYPIDVSCENRGRTQPPQATEDCPHQFGYYRLGDKADCGRFMNCASGRSYIFECPEGLAFNKDQYRCDWPDQVDDCDEEAYLNFKCPQIQKSSELGFEEQRTYKSPHDCHHYYVCLEGKPRLLSCGEDRGFNEATSSCDDIENVPGCSILFTIFRNLWPNNCVKYRIFVMYAYSAPITDFECPDDDEAIYPDPEQCDAFIECKNGIPHRQLCPDGLVYNHRIRNPRQHCQFKPLVDCGSRTKLQPAKSTKRCRNQNGMFRIGDSAHCAKYYNCAHGVGTLSKCAVGLAFNEANYRCDYPELVAECNITAYLGFKCPEQSDNLDDYDESAVETAKHYVDEKNMNHYFICDVEGNVRKYSCAKDLIYNVETRSCEVAEFEYYDDDETASNITTTTSAATIKLESEE